MQLKKLYIKDYKILKDFTIEFPYDFNQYISILIGTNGSGKSTILEAIAKVFSNVYLNEKAEFGFELVYSVNLEKTMNETSTTKDSTVLNLMVKLSAEKEGDYVKFEFHDKDYSKENINLLEKGFSADSFFPDNVIVYYSGLSEHMENLFKKHEQIQQVAFYNNQSFAKKRFFYYKPENFNMILLALLSFEYGAIKDELFEKLNITELSGFVITVKNPNTSWSKGKKSEEFWGAKGAIGEFLAVLNKYAKFTIAANYENTLEFHFPTMGRLYSIKDHYGSERKLFELLEITSYEGMLENIEITLNKGAIQTSSVPQEGEIHFNSKRLSEGEQQAIIIKGLTELLSEKNSLFLFDEPDTYLHPKWQRQFISEIQKFITDSYNLENSFVIATHSPQLLSNAKSELNFVKIIENGEIIENTPKHYGREINSILYDLMGVEERNELVRNEISELYNLIAEEKIKDAESKLKDLRNLIGLDDPALKRAEIQIAYLKEDE